MDWALTWMFLNLKTLFFKIYSSIHLIPQFRHEIYIFKSLILTSGASLGLLFVERNIYLLNALHFKDIIALQYVVIISF